MSDAEADAKASNSQENSVSTELSRDMSLADITFIGVGAMIGAGIFALTGYAAGIAGPALTVAFILNGIVALFTAVSYAELGAAFPEAGGGYLWVQEALVEPNGFYAGWMSWFAHAVACGLYAVTFGTYFVQFVIYGFGLSENFQLFGLIGVPMLEKGLAAVVAALFAYINYRGAEETGRAELVVVTFKLIILGLFIIFGLYATFTNPQWPTKFKPFVANGVTGIIGAMGFTYIAFEGYEIIVQSGEEVVKPERNIPKAVLYSLVIVVPIYVLVAVASIGGIHVTPELLSQHGINANPSSIPTYQLLGKLGELGIVQAAKQFMPFGEALLLLAGLSATTSALNATVYSSSRVSFAMGRNRELPAFFEHIDPDRRTPSTAILLSAILIIVMAVTLPIESVAAASDIMFILLFVQVNWTLIRMRTSHPDLERTFEVPFMPWPPLIGIVAQFILLPFLIYELGLQAIGIGSGNDGLVALVVTAVWMLIGLGVFYGYSKPQQEVRREEETPTVVTERQPHAREHQILVPIANPAHVQQLMRTAIDLARDKDSEILVMSAITVPQQTPLEEGREFVDEQRQVINEAMGYADEVDIPVSGTVRIGHDIPQAILNTIEQEDTDQVLLGWRGHSHRRDAIVGSNIDPIVAQAPCDVLVERIGDDSQGKMESILLPTAGGPHAELAAEVAQAIGRANDASVDVVSVVGSNDPEEDRENAQQAVDDIAAIIEDVTVNTRIIEDDNVTDALVESSSGYDLLLLGAARSSVFERLIFGALPETVSERAKCTVIMAKRNVDVTSRITHWLGN